MSRVSFSALSTPATFMLSDMNTQHACWSVSTKLWRRVTTLELSFYSSHPSLAPTSFQKSG